MSKTDIYHKAFELRRDGNTYSRIGELLGISIGKAKDYSEFGEYRFTRSGMEFVGLDRSACWFILSFECHSKEDAVSAVVDGRIYPGMASDCGRYLLGWGPVRHKKLCGFLGIDYEKTTSNIVPKKATRCIEYLTKRGYSVTKKSEDR